MPHIPDVDGDSFLRHLLELGRDERFEDIRAFAASHDRREFSALIDHGLSAVGKFSLGLIREDRDALIKAIAVYEDAVREVGSMSMNRELLFYRPGGDNTALDWVLRNTRGWYYGKGARSLEEYESSLVRAANRRMAAVAKEDLRYARSVQERARKATAALCNALCRRDAAALAALFARGGDSRVTCPDGGSLLEQAHATGSAGLIALVESDLATEMLLSRLLELGKSGDFDDALRLGQGWRASVNAVLAKKELIWRKVVRHADGEQLPLIKALVKFDEGLDRIGQSHSLAADKISYVPGGDNALFDWVLRNTSGWFRARGARSLVEYDQQLKQDFMAVLALEQEQARVEGRPVPDQYR